MSLTTQTVQKIRISAGSATVLGFWDKKIDTKPTTCYIMTYSMNKCIGNCSFCPQGNAITNSKSAETLSRIQWPSFAFTKFLTNFEENQKLNQNDTFRRVCLQVINYKGFYKDVCKIIKSIKEITPKINISIAIPPISREKLTTLKELGTERIGISLDACNPELFKKIKGNNKVYTWDEHWKSLENSIEIFGIGKTTTHLIVGMGETEKEMITNIEHVISKKILPGIFLFTPIRGTRMENVKRPNILQFRHIQIARYLLLIDQNNLHRFIFDENGSLAKIKNLDRNELDKIIELQQAFKTAGCPNCNRPYYNSRPGEEQGGYPRDLTQKEKRQIFDELSHLYN